MARYYGAIGYSLVVETDQDVHEEQIIERSYFGNVTRNNKRTESGEHLNDNLNVNVTISIVADAFATMNFHHIRYVHWMGARWKVTQADATQRPRIILTIGGVYNGPTPEATGADPEVDSKVD